MKKTLLLLLIFISAKELVFAQDDRPDRAGIGVGPAMMYGDNTGINRQLKFKVLPVLTLDYNKKIHTFFDVRLSVGWQMVNSGDFYKPRTINKIARAGLPHGFKGNAFFADIMPVFHINPNQSGYLPATYKVYVGTGIGVAHVNRTDTFMTIPDDPNSIIYESGNNTSVYIPFRPGISKDYMEVWEIALEPSMLVSLFGELDGNDLQQKIIKPDILFQFQFYLRRKLN